MVRCGFSPPPDASEQGDVEEDLGEDAAVSRSLSLSAMTLRPTTTFRAPPASERASVVNPIFAGSGSRMKRQPWPAGGLGSGSSGGGGGSLGSGSSGGACAGAGAGAVGLGIGGTDRRTSLASIETDMSSGDLDAAENSGGFSGESPAYTAGAGAGARAAPPDGRGRRADLGAAPAATVGGNGGGLSSHPSSWTGYGGGGAAAWVRSAKGTAPPAPRGGKGGKGGHRRTNSRY